MFDKNNLIELLKFHNSIGVDLVADFSPGKSPPNLMKLKKPVIDSSDKEEISIKDENLPSTTIENQEKMSIQKIKEELASLNDPQEILMLKRFSTQTVIGDGVQDAKILLIGEAPGEEEDINGIPFCGRSGMLLNEALSKIGLSRAKNLYITNTVFWRPMNNRKPEDKEIKACRPFLNKIIKAINPEIIITSGSVSTLAILETDSPISSLIGNFYEKTINERKIKIFPIYHPSYLLRNPSSKKVLWKNLLTLKKELIDLNLL